MGEKNGGDCNKCENSGYYQEFWMLSSRPRAQILLVLLNLLTFYFSFYFVTTFAHDLRFSIYICNISYMHSILFSWSNFLSYNSCISGRTCLNLVLYITTIIQVSMDYGLWSYHARFNVTLIQQRKYLRNLYILCSPEVNIKYSIR